MTSSNFTPKPQERPPEVAGYTLWTPIGRGSTGPIWLARRDRAEGPCAIKLVERRASGRSLERFKREAHLTSLLNHKNIVKVFDAGASGTHFFQAMELIRGASLKHLLAKLAQRNRVLPIGATLRVAIEVLEALRYAHNFKDPEGRHLGIVHRDLAPGNIMLTFDGQTKLIDFGLARAQIGPKLTEMGRINGTPRYMSPQQALGKPVDQRADIYGFAVVLYELLSGHALVRGRALREQLAEVVIKTPPPISSVNKQLPRALDAVFQRALAKESADRFSSANAFARSLVQAMRGAFTPWSSKQLSELISDLFDAEKRTLDGRLGRFLQEHQETAANSRLAAKFEMTRDATAEASDTALYLGPGLDSLDVFDSLPTIASPNLRELPPAQAPSSTIPAGLFWVGLATGLVFGVGGLQLALRFLC